MGVFVGNGVGLGVFVALIDCVTVAEGVAVFVEVVVGVFVFVVVGV